MALDEESLELVAQDGTMDFDKWPSLLQPFLERLETIAHNEFPIPIFPSPDPIPAAEDLLSSDYDPSSSQQPNAKENSVPARSPRSIPPVPSFDSSATTTSTSTSRIQDSTALSQQDPSATLPPPLDALLYSITNTIRTSFATKPPHTIQRLAELILHPTKHQKTLPAWLRAVDRVVSVSSSADIFPLPHALPLPNGVIDSSLLNGSLIVNGTTGGETGTAGFSSGISWPSARVSYDEGLGSDESLGGALLTPIPWLKDGDMAGLSAAGSPRSSSTIESATSGPNNGSLVPERENGAVTQGELIRQEQEAGAVPVARPVIHNTEGAESGTADEDEVPHARGPDTVGVEDMGLQDGKDVHVQLGRKGTDGPGESGTEKDGPAIAIDTPQSSEGTLVGDEMETDTEVVDPDGKTERDKEMAEASGENVGPDASDTTAL